MSTDRKHSITELTDLEAYKIALETRNMEIGLFWQRSNYFLVLNGALALGFFRVTNDKYAVLLAILGAVVSFLWFQVVLGSKFWQSRWEERLKLKEEVISPDLNYFSSTWEIINDDVKNNLGYNDISNSKSHFKKWIDKQILKKPSVSYNMLLLSISFLTGWLILILMRVLIGL